MPILALAAEKPERQGKGGVLYQILASRTHGEVDGPGGPCEARSLTASKNRRQVFASSLVTAVLIVALVGLIASTVGGRSGVTGRTRADLAAKNDATVLDTSCHTAEKGETCHNDVVYAMEHRSEHAEWYTGLDEKSKFKDFQAFMHTQKLQNGDRRCPKPCGFVNYPNYNIHERSRKKQPKCHDAVPGDKCYNHVIYTQQQLLDDPLGHPGLTIKSSTRDVQYYLFQEGECPKPCGMEDHKLKKTPKEEGDCHTAAPGDSCFQDVLYAMDEISAKPEWYPGLKKTSSRHEVQAFLHMHNKKDDQGKRCPLPCDGEAVKNITRTAKETCHTTQKGEPCYARVRWAVHVGMEKNPQWYPGLSRDSTLEEFQAHLYAQKEKEGKCSDTPCPCHTTVEGEACHKSVQWVLNTGIHKHAKWYPGLTAQSTPEEVQARLHSDKTTTCWMPCTALPE